MKTCLVSKTNVSFLYMTFPAFPGSIGGFILAMTAPANFMGYCLPFLSIVKPPWKDIRAVAGVALPLYPVSGGQGVAFMVKGDSPHPIGEEKDLICPGLGSGQVSGLDLGNIAFAIHVSILLLYCRKIKFTFFEALGIRIEEVLVCRQMAGPAVPELGGGCFWISLDKERQHARGGVDNGWNCQDEKENCDFSGYSFHCKSPLN